MWQTLLVAVGTWTGIATGLGLVTGHVMSWAGGISAFAPSSA
jgi:hypothetical protein